MEHVTDAARSFESGTESSKWFDYKAQIESFYDNNSSWGKKKKKSIPVSSARFTGHDGNLKSIGRAGVSAFTQPHFRNSRRVNRLEIRMHPRVRESRDYNFGRHSWCLGTFAYAWWDQVEISLYTGEHVQSTFIRIQQRDINEACFGPRSIRLRAMSIGTPGETFVQTIAINKKGSSSRRSDIPDFLSVPVSLIQRLSLHITRKRVFCRVDFLASISRIGIIQNNIFYSYLLWDSYLVEKVNSKSASWILSNGFLNGKNRRRWHVGHCPTNSEIVLRRNLSGTVRTVPCVRNESIGVRYL